VTERIIMGREVAVRYDEHAAVDGVDLEVDAEESVAIVGPSGSGKSSLMHCLAGLIAPDRGSVRLCEVDLGRCSAEQRAAIRRRHVGFVFQFADLVPELTLVDNVALPCELNGIDRRSSVGRAHEALDRLGIGALAHRRPAQVSGGERQRAAVCRAVVHRPHVVFADEPTGALDSENGAQVMDELLAVTRSVGAALVVVTHDPSVAGRCDRTLAMRDGRIDHGATSPR
jgi:putative ABC transport system ATP-binding protein